jgi:hypothetical protein
MPIKGDWEAESTDEGGIEVDCPKGGSNPDAIEGEGANELNVECGVLGLDACELGLVASPPLR